MDVECAKCGQADDDNYEFNMPLAKARAICRRPSHWPCLACERLRWPQKRKGYPGDRALGL